MTALFFTPHCAARKSVRIHGRSGNTGKAPRTGIGRNAVFTRRNPKPHLPARQTGYVGGAGSRCTASSPHRRRKGKNVLYKRGSRAGAYMAPVRLPTYIESPLCVIQHPYPIAVLQGACSCCSARGRLPVRHRTTPGLPPGTVSLPKRNAPPL